MNNKLKSAGRTKAKIAVFITAIVVLASAGLLFLWSRAGQNSPTYDPKLFSAQPATIQLGKDQVMLQWDIPDAETVFIEGLPGSFGAAGRHILQKDHPLLINSGIAPSNEGRGKLIFTLDARIRDGSSRKLQTEVTIASQSE